MFHRNYKQRLFCADVHHGGEYLNEKSVFSFENPFDQHASLYVWFSCQKGIKFLKSEMFFSLLYLKNGKKKSRGKMKRRNSCREADLSRRSLRPVVWALTLFDIETQRRERRSEAETSEL